MKPTPIDAELVPSACVPLSRVRGGPAAAARSPRPRIWGATLLGLILTACGTPPVITDEDASIPVDVSPDSARDVGLDGASDGSLDVSTGDDASMPEASVDAGCPSGQTACAGRCVDVQSDRAHCGACGSACPGGQLCVMGSCRLDCPAPRTLCTAGSTMSCADTSSDLSNCGACEQVCPEGPNASAVCASGSCGLSCSTGFADCNGVAADGCEIDTRSATAHCGGCGFVCPSRANSLATCSASVCGFSCSAGFADCNAVASDGCETDTRSATAHCGACGNACPSRANSVATCNASVCGFTCTTGFADCNGNATDGCEVDTRSSTAHCGACGNSCPSGYLCVAGSCQLTCTAPLRVCTAGSSMSCVDTSADTANCGACGTVCPSRANASATCQSSACGISCNAGFGNCNGVATDGCEVDTRTSLSHCGACGNACPGRANATATCTASACGFRCSTGFGDCNGIATDGCEIDTRSAVDHCGACGNACPTRANATRTCASSTCGMTCLSGFANCNGVASDGCEIDLRTSATNCGACGNVCLTRANSTPICTASTCGLSCNAGFADCNRVTSDGCEVDTRSALSNCGACGNVCPSGANATATCTAGECGLRCSAGFEDCNGVASDGCEVDTRTSAANCGACGTVCPSGPNATATCSASACGLRCNAGFADCNGLAADGCEVRLADDDSNCGACGTVCTGAQRCISSRCQLPVARPIAPLSTSTVTSRRPTLRWVLSGGADGARVELCRDRACTMVLERLTGTTSAAPTADLPTGVVFWRLFASRGAVESPTPSPTWQMVVGARSAPVDSSFGTTPDVNGDGLADLLIGEPGANRVRVYLGDRRGAPATAHQMLGSPQNTTFLGGSVASAGDVNGDGFSDILVGARHYDYTARPDYGGAMLYLGSATGVRSSPDQVLPARAANDGFGRTVASAGDVNGDGYADVIIGAPDASPGGFTGVGTATVYLGSATGLSTTPHRVLEGALSNDRFGWSVASAGDVNGDGYGDVIVGAPYQDGGGLTDRGAAWVFLGSASGLSTTPALVLYGARNGEHFGKTVAGAGDTNGDGFADVIVGFPDAGGGYGVYPGGATGVSATPLRFSSADGGTIWAEAVAGAGDVDGDGYADIIIGSPHDTLYPRVQAGRASVYFGSPAGPISTTSYTLHGTSNGAHFGAAVAGAGDINGDGFGDLLIGAPDVGSGSFPPGAASVFLGDGMRFDPPVHRVYDGYSQLGWSVASAGDGALEGRACWRAEARAIPASQPRRRGAALLAPRG